MRKLISVIILVIFTIWIMPLGVFIKPEHEKKACSGKRAICLCTHLLKKKMAKMAGKQFLKSGGNVNKEQNNPSSSGQEYIHSIKTHNFKLAKNQYFQSAAICINQVFTRAVEHVPKV